MQELVLSPCAVPLTFVLKSAYKPCMDRVSSKLPVETMCLLPGWPLGVELAACGGCCQSLTRVLAGLPVLFCISHDVLTWGAA